MELLHMPALIDFFASRVVKHAHFQIREVSQLNSGWECEVFAVSTATDAGAAQDYILRFYQGQSAAEKCETECETECEGMDRLRKLGYPVPGIYIAECDSSVLGKPFVLMEKIAGSTLADVMRQTPAEGRKYWLTAFCQMFVNLHRLDWWPFVSETQESTQHPYTSVDAFITRVSRMVQEYKIPGIEPVFQWFLQHRDEVPCEKPCVIHWDFHPENILIQPNHQMFVIDWTQIEVADFRFDVAWTLLVCSAHDPTLRDVILTEYERISGTKVQNLWFFEAAALLKRVLTILITLEYGAESLGMREATRHLIATNVEYVQLLFKRLADITQVQMPTFEAFIGTYVNPGV